MHVTLCMKRNGVFAATCRLSLFLSCHFSLSRSVLSMGLWIESRLDLYFHRSFGLDYATPQKHSSAAINNFDKMITLFFVAHFNQPRLTHPYCNASIASSILVRSYCVSFPFSPSLALSLDLCIYFPVLHESWILYLPKRKKAQYIIISIFIVWKKKHRKGGKKCNRLRVHYCVEVLWVEWVAVSGLVTVLLLFLLTFFFSVVSILIAQSDITYRLH